MDCLPTKEAVMEGHRSAAAGPPSSSGLNLVAHPRAKSKVWKYFGFDTDADGCIVHWKRIYCRICVSQIAYSGNTSNLSYHLEKNHPAEFGEFVKSNTDHMREVFGTSFPRIKPEPPSSSSTGGGGLSLKPSAPHAHDAAANLRGQSGLGYENRRHNDLTLAVVNFVCEGMHPVSVVEERTFRALLRAADPRYSPPSRGDLALKMLPQMYFHARDAVLTEVAGVANCGVAADLWRSPAHNRAYISLSLHAVHVEAGGRFSATSKCLKTFEVREDDGGGGNAAENITRAMYEAFVEWGITHKVSGATTDGALRDVAKACSLLELSVQMPCLGHAVSRGVGEAFALPRVDAFLGRCRRLVDHFRETAVAAYLLKEKQRQHHGLAPQRPLVKDRGGGIGGDCCWPSTLAMLRRLAEQRAAVAATLVECASSGAADESHHFFGFGAGDWALAEGLVELLQPFKVVADMMTSCKYPTISMVRPVLHMLLNTTLAAKDGDLKEVGTAKEVIAAALSAAYAQTAEIGAFLNVATFLDPRYKRLPFLSPQERSRVEAHVVEEAKAILEKQQGSGEQQQRPDVEFSSLSSSSGGDEPPSKKQATGGAGVGESAGGGSSSSADNPLAAIFCQSDSDQSQAELHAQVVEELSNYKSQRILGLNEDPLLWWSNHAALFPTLPRVLQKYWCVPATSVPCHRLFGSSGGAALAAKRNRVAPALVDQQVFLYENSRSYYEPEPADDDLEDVGGAAWDCGGYVLGQPLE